MGPAPLVGREEPLLRLRRVLDESLAGIGRLVLVSGEPGIGKTRLALEILGEAAVEARFRPSACAGTVPARRECGPGSRSSERCGPTLGDLGWEHAGGPGHGALTRLLDSERPLGPPTSICSSRCSRCSPRSPAGAPWQLLLDDVQWADPASLALLEFLHRHAAHLPLLAIATYRADELARPEHPGAQP